MEQIGYKKTIKSKVVRVKHKVTFSVGTNAFNLMEMLKYVPDKAEVDEVLVDDETEKASIEFHEERLNE